MQARQNSSSIVPQTSFSWSRLIDEHLQKKGILKEVSYIITWSWKTSSIIQYKSVFRKWSVFCMRHKNNFIPTIRDQKSVLAILTEYIRDGYSYSTIFKARSAIYNVVSPSLNWNISDDPLVSRFMRGTFSVQRSLPKHSAFCHVLQYLHKIYSETCSLYDITHKVVSLLCLASFGRAHTISLIMEVSSESPRVPPGIGWGICQFSAPEG